jgi:hypothetical protein
VVASCKQETTVPVVESTAVTSRSSSLDSSVNLIVDESSLIVNDQLQPALESSAEVAANKLNPPSDEQRAQDIASNPSPTSSVELQRSVEMMITDQDDEFSLTAKKTQDNVDSSCGAGVNVTSGGCDDESSEEQAVVESKEGSAARFQHQTSSLNAQISVATSASEKQPDPMSGVNDEVDNASLTLNMQFSPIVTAVDDEVKSPGPLSANVESTAAAVNEAVMAEAEAANNENEEDKSHDYNWVPTYCEVNINIFF